MLKDDFKRLYKIEKDFAKILEYDEWNYYSPKDLQHKPLLSFEKIFSHLFRYWTSRTASRDVLAPFLHYELIKIGPQLHLIGISMLSDVMSYIVRQDHNALFKNYIRSLTLKEIYRVVKPPFIFDLWMHIVEKLGVDHMFRHDVEPF